MRSITKVSMGILVAALLAGCGGSGAQTATTPQATSAANATSAVNVTSAAAVVPTTVPTTTAVPTVATEAAMTTTEAAMTTTEAAETTTTARETTTAAASTTVEAAAVPSGWKAYDQSAAGFTFALPTNWEVIDLSRQDAQQLLDEIAQKVPALADTLKGGAMQAQLSNGLKLFGYDTSVGDGTAARRTINVIVQRLPGQAPFDQLVEQVVASLEQLPVRSGPVSHRRLTHPQADVEEIEYLIEAQAADGKTVKAQTVQYLLAQGSRIVIVSFSMPPEEKDTLVPTLDQIAQTFRLQP